MCRIVETYIIVRDVIEQLPWPQWHISIQMLFCSDTMVQKKGDNNGYFKARYLFSIAARGQYTG